MPNNFPEGYERISTALTQLKGEGLWTPQYDGARRWVELRKVRSLRYGSGQILVHVEDLRSMCTPVPVE